MAIPEVQIEQVRAVADIVAVVGARVALTRKGQNHVGLCPFHDEKTASFTVHAGKGIYHCFGCGEGGNVISFVMATECMTFPEAVRHLGGRFGVVIQDESGPDAARAKGERERVQRVLDRALAWFRHQWSTCPADGPVATYVQGRGLDPDTISTFEIGWAPERWDGLTGALRGEGIPAADLVLAGVSVRRDADRGGAGRHGNAQANQNAGSDRNAQSGPSQDRLYDRFRGRLMFPIRDAAGTLAGFGGRALGDGTPKYLNSPETPRFHKGRVLYGLDQVRAGGGRVERIAVVEGYLDVIACHRAGLNWAVAPLGTALTVDHGRLLCRYTDRVDLVFDGDRAGRAAAVKAAATLAPMPLEVRVVTLAGDDDPDSLLAREPADAVATRLRTGIPLMDFLFEEKLGHLRGAPVERRLAAAGEVMAVLRTIPDALRQDHYLGRLAEYLQVAEQSLRRDYVKASRTAARTAARAAPAAHANAGVTADAGPVGPTGPVPHAEDMLMHLVFHGSVPVRWMLDRVPQAAFTDARVRRVAAVLAAVDAARPSSVDRKPGTDAPPAEALARIPDRLLDDREATALVTGWLTRELTLEGDLEVSASACVAALAAPETKEVSQRLQQQILAAQEAGNTALLSALLSQKNELAKHHRRLVAG